MATRKAVQFKTLIRMPDPDKVPIITSNLLIKVGMEAYAAARNRAQKHHQDALGQPLPEYSKGYKARKASEGKSTRPDLTYTGKMWSVVNMGVSIFSKRLDKARLRNFFRGSWKAPKNKYKRFKGSSKKLARAAKAMRAELGRDLTSAEWFQLRRSYLETADFAARAKAWQYAKNHPNTYLMGYHPVFMRRMMIKWRNHAVALCNGDGYKKVIEVKS